jgi:hypothetical protein
MENELLTGEQLRDKVESLWLKHIKLCQDNFLYFVKEMWPDIIFKKEKDKSKWGHHQVIADEFTKIAKQKKGGSLSICHLDILNLNLLPFIILHGL